MSGFVRNSWYAAAWESEIGAGMLPRRILDEPVILFRSPEHGIVALLDQCPHRLLPLSMGNCAEGRIQCGYHGMEFDGSGHCIRIPGQARIPPTAKVRSFPVALRYGLVWIWMGAAEAADPALLPVVERHGQAGWAVLGDGYQRHESGYRNIIENLMDPAHTTFVHKDTIANPAAANQPVEIGKVEGGIVAYRWVENAPPTPFDRAVMTQAGAVDRAQFFYFLLPGISRVDIISVPAGTERVDDKLDSGLRTFSYKFLTPETASSTHFFWLHVRNYRLGDTAWETILRGNLEKTFLEDAVIVAAIQREQTRTGLRQQTGLDIDRAPAMAMGLLDRMIAKEAAVDLG